MKESRPLAECPPYHLGAVDHQMVGHTYGARSVSLLVSKGPDGPKPILLAWGRRTLVGALGGGPMDGSC
jgi:hypothetical protein